MLTVSRAVVQVHPEFHPEGGRFLVKPYPKDKEYRRFKLSAQITAKLQAHVEERGLGRDDLLFQAPGGRAAGAGAAPFSRPRRTPGPHRAERGWPPLPARHAHRLLRSAAAAATTAGTPTPLPRRAARGGKDDPRAPRVA